MEKSQEELIEEASALFGGFEGLLEKLPFQASTLRLLKARNGKMSDKLRGDVEKLIEMRNGVSAAEVPTIIDEAPLPLEETRFSSKSEQPVDADHPEVVTALFDEATQARLNRLATASRLSPAQLIRVGTLRYMDQIEKTGEIIIRFNPKDNP